MYRSAMIVALCTAALASPITAATQAEKRALRPASQAVQTVTTDAANHSVTPDMRTLPLHIGGRVQAIPLPPPMPKGAMIYWHHWPAIYFEGAFVGDRVVLKFDDAGNEYRLLVDGQPPIPFFRPGKVEIAISGLGAKPHRLRLEKVSESFLGHGAFGGFYIPKDERPLPVKSRRRQIEFIGPSGLTGFGDRSTKSECTFDEMARTTDAQQAYPALVAKHFNADYQVNATSGRGLLRNVKEARKEPGLIAIHSSTFIDQIVPYSDPKWQPQMIEIMPFADFVTDLEAGEKWTSFEQFVDDWTRSYQALVLDLHHRSPRAAFLLDWADESDVSGPGPDVDLFRKKLAAARRTITEMGRRSGIREIEFITYGSLRGKLDQTGCLHHGSLKDHRVTAAWLEGVIDSHPGIWDGK